MDPERSTNPVFAVRGGGAYAREARPLYFFLLDLSARSITQLNRPVGGTPGLLSGERDASLEEHLEKVHPDDLARVNDAVLAWLRTDSEPSAIEVEFRLLRDDGRWSWMRCRTVVSERDEQGHAKVILGTSEDITESRRVEDIGELATEMAHELRQPLAVIASYAQGCSRRLREAGGDAALLAVIDRITDEALRAAEYVQHLRSLASKEATARQDLDVNELLRKVFADFAPDAESCGIALKLETQASLPPVHGDRLELEHLVLNLLRNALEASNGVETREPQIVVHTEKDERGSVLLTVTDSGVGFSGESASRLFERGFTTKPGGMGMGLAISQSIVHSHGGRISAAANEGQGATFRVELPAATAEQGRPAAKSRVGVTA